MALPDVSDPLLDEILARKRAADPRHRVFVDRCNRFYRLYRAYKDVRRDYADAVQGQKVDDFFRDYGGWTQLLVPYAFSVIETTVPRILSANPQINVEPGDPQSEDNVDAMRLMIDREQELIGMWLRLQNFVKCGLINGFAVGKDYWHVDAYDRPGRKPAATAGPNGQVQYVECTERHVRYEGPMFEVIDPFDFFASPGATNAQTMRWAIHRTWPTSDDVRERFSDSGPWQLPAGATIEDVLALAAPDGGKENVYGTRDRYAGFGGAHGAETNRWEGRPHELLEFWDGKRVVKVLDQQLVVEQGTHPYWHRELPFPIYRPTQEGTELYGIGEVEAIEDLVKELSFFRSSRLDNAKLVLQRPFAYFDGFVNVKDFQFGPGAMIPTEGDPRELLFPLPMQDIPASSFQEVADMRSDIERTSGIDDTLSGGANSPGGAPETATGVQLIQAAANVRIQNKTRIVEEEAIAPMGRRWGSLNQQFITTERQVKGPPKPSEPDRPWSWYDVGPAELAGNFAFSVNGGSTSPENDAAKAQKAQAFMLQFGQDPIMDPRKVRVHALSLQGIRNPETWLKPEEPNIPATALDMIQQAIMEDLHKAGVDPAQVGLDAQGFHELVAGAVQEAQGPAPGAQQGPQQPPSGP